MSLWFKKLLARTGLARFTAAARRLPTDTCRFLHYYSDRTLAAPLEAMLDPALLARADAPDWMDLNLASPRFDSPVSVSRVYLDRGALPPPQGLPSLRETITARLTRRGGLPASGEVVVTHGASGALAAVLDAFVGPGDSIVLFDPCSPLLALGAQSRRARIRWVPTWQEETRTRFLLDGLRRALRGARMLILADPNNPTGGVLDHEDLQKIAWLARRHDVLVVLDHSLNRYRYDSSPPPLVCIPEFTDRLLLLESISQGYGLAGLRVGWLAGPGGLVRAAAMQACLNAPFVSLLGQEIADQALRGAEELFLPTLAKFQERRKYVIERLRGLGLEPSWPGGGYFTWVNLNARRPSGRALFDELARQHRVLVSPGDLYGPTGQDAIRISFAQEDGRLREGLRRLDLALLGERVAAPRAPCSEPEAAPAFSRM